MRHSEIILIISYSLLIGFARPNKSGKELFTKYCAPCHRPNNTLIGPPFQNIRKDYGLSWTLKFVKDNQLLIKQRDSRALYIYYTYNMTMQSKFNHLADTDIVKILDYVDRFPVDTTQYSHRTLDEKGRLQYISNYEMKQNPLLEISYDTFPSIDTIRTPRRKGTVKKKSQENGM